MGTQVGRIEKEFVFKSLIDNKIPLELHGNQKEFKGIIIQADDEKITIQGESQSMEDLTENDQVRAFFYFKNNYHTFNSTVLKTEGNILIVKHPEGVYKNLQRKYERIKMPEGIEVSFTLKGKKIELNFPKSSIYKEPEPPKVSKDFDISKISTLVNSFRKKMSLLVSENKIMMFRDKMPKTYDEKIIVKTGKIFWIPSTEDEFPVNDPFPDERIIIKRDLVKYEENLGTPPYIITSKLGNILYEKTKKDIFSEVFVPIIYNEYIVGYIHIYNTQENRKRITENLVDYVYQFSKVLAYALKINGYFNAEKSNEKKYEAPVIDMSASGILFSHTSPELGRELMIHTDLDLIVIIQKRKLIIGSRIMRKFQDNSVYFFGVQFLRIAPEDFRFLFEFLYGKPFMSKYENVWEGGAPPPPLEIFNE
ncbi:MAG: hypothetical protein DRP57_05360 [Spirochaetes bacterium]|nr:MAG: hypothetical protein DRP57_05360 [Spirochaetota bacterium]